VADLSSQSSQCFRPVFRRAVVAHLHGQSCWATRERSAMAQIATSQQQLTLSARKINPRSPQCDRRITHRAAAVSGGSRRAPYDRSWVALSIRSPPQSRHNSSRRSLVGLTHLETISYESSRPGKLPCFRARGLGFEKAQRAARPAWDGRMTVRPLQL
jgi:hypothetical protein